MADKAGARGWTDAEKVGLFLQIIAKAGPVPWPDITLPEGRTVKACQVMLDKEKQKIKKAREAAGEEADAELSSPKKRKAADADGGKAKKGRKGKATDNAEQSDDEKVPEMPKKGGRKKTKAARTGSDELVKEEDVEDMV